MAHIQIRIDDAEKQSAQEVLKGMGLTLSGATKLFLRKVITEQKIPFDITAGARSSAPVQKDNTPEPNKGRFQNRVIA